MPLASPAHKPTAPELLQVPREEAAGPKGGIHLPLVRDAMTSPIVTCGKKESCREVARLMRKHDIGILPVMDGARVAGVITDRDLVLRHVAEGHLPPEKTRVETCMTSKVVSVTSDASLSDALRIMKENGVRRLVVIDEDEPKGMLSLDDILLRVGRSWEIGKVIDELLVQWPLGRWP